VKASGPAITAEREARAGPVKASVAHLKEYGTAIVMTFAATSNAREAKIRSVKSRRPDGQM
jgi:hypothetical protein